MNCTKQISKQEEAEIEAKKYRISKEADNMYEVLSKILYWIPEGSELDNSIWCCMGRNILERIK